MRRRGLLFPSPVVMLSIIAVAMAAIAYVATRDSAPTEREVVTVAQDPAPSASSRTPSVPEAREKPRREPKPAEPAKPAKPVVKRGEVYVEVYNNSGITGLAGQVAVRATDAGWKVVGSDNWYGTVSTSTVYHPPRLARAAKLLALDLGITRTAPAVGAMRLDRLTVVLTGALG